ncbi:unnamed protein product [Heterobilharzia americana]|nr:unnamed protein product [Heterobilharzia americana]
MGRSVVLMRSDVVLGGRRDGLNVRWKVLLITAVLLILPVTCILLSSYGNTTASWLLTNVWFVVPVIITTACLMVTYVILEIYYISLPLQILFSVLLDIALSITLAILSSFFEGKWCLIALGITAVIAFLIGVAAIKITTRKSLKKIVLYITGGVLLLIIIISGILAALDIQREVFLRLLASCLLVISCYMIYSFIQLTWRGEFPDSECLYMSNMLCLFLLALFSSILLMFPMDGSKSCSALEAMCMIGNCWFKSIGHPIYAWLYDVSIL